ncbi:hypothetical protein AYK24_07935 [Thermoplasmatales archaeon SG8-52-4]|nr:MAG: hypothetical protein AYK24_07935 [Thermoplasmatales archaeon SG8-52-4]
MIIFLFISIWKLFWIWIFGCILALIVSFVPTILKRNYQITLPLVLEILITIALILHVGGGLLGAYGITHYDTLTHFVSSFLVAFLAFVVIYILDEYWDGLIMDKYALAFLVVITTIAMGVVWEFNEWITDILFGTHEQWGYDDTIKDLFIDMIAGLVMAFIGVAMIKRGSFDELTEDLGEQIDKLIIKSNKDETKK